MQQQENYGLYCPHCQQMRMFVRTNYIANHLVHALVTLFLCGLWIPVWIIASMQEHSTDWICTQCGSKPMPPSS